MCNQQIKDDCNKCGFLNDSWLFPRYVAEKGYKLSHTCQGHSGSILRDSPETISVRHSIV